MIVLGKIVRLKTNYSRILEDYTTDILSIVTRGTTTSIEINKQIVELITDLASQRNIKEIVTFLESEIRNIKHIDNEKDHQLLSSYHKVVLNCCKEVSSRFEDTIPQVMDALLSNFLTFETPQLITTSANTTMFLREVIERKPLYREALFKKLT